MTEMPISYDPADLEALARIEEGHFWFRARRRIIVEALARWFGKAESYLEIGCGTGYNARAVAEAFPRWRIVASDPLAPGSATFPRIDALDIPFQDEFDVVGAYDVLEHIRDDSAALRQFRKACRPGGGILVTVPQHPWLWSASDTHAHHHRRYGARGFLRLVERAGFEILGWNSFVTLSLPLFFLRARVLLATGRKPNANVPPAPVNWLLERSMNLERRLIRSGIRLPIGASLLVAARRQEGKPT
jgi:SAM-dependent methyltransferase